MTITKRQRGLLTLMREGHEAVEETGAVWIDLERTNVATLLFFLRNILVSLDYDHCGVRHYTLSSWGRRALDDPSFDSSDELRTLLIQQRDASE